MRSQVVPVEYARHNSGLSNKRFFGFGIVQRCLQHTRAADGRIELNDLPLPTLVKLHGGTRYVKVHMGFNFTKVALLLSGSVVEGLGEGEQGIVETRHTPYLAIV